MRARRTTRAGLAAVAALALALTAACSAPSPAGSATRRPSSTGSVAPSPTGSETPSAATSWAREVAAENARRGDPGALGGVDRLKAAGLAAYADRVSVLPGQDVGLYVLTAKPEPITVTAYRVGWYGGAGFRDVWHGVVQAGPQPPPTTLDQPLADAGGADRTRAVVAPWHLSGLVSTTGWPEGMYVLRLDGASASRLVPLTLRSASTAGRLVVLDSPMTWQAYNTWGGRGLYGDEAKSFARRSYAVSFDRPYDDGYGAGRFFEYVAPLLRRAERLGLPLAWATDYDVALDPSLLAGATGIVVGSHQEYWTATERDAVAAAQRAGTNVAFFGANTAYWRVRLAGRDVALSAQPDRRDGRPRVLFGPKSASQDPLAASDPAGATTRFRDPPAPQPEEALTGLRYDCYPVQGSWVVSDASWWGYAGTGLADRERLARLVGPESDRLVDSPDRPRPMQVVAWSPLRCRGRTTDQAAVYWSTPAGAGVFAAGTLDWAQGIVRPDTASAVATITDNVLRAFASPRAGIAHPPVDNVASVNPPTQAPPPPP